MNDVKETTLAPAVIEADITESDLQQYHSLLDQEMIVRMGDNLMGVHPNAKEVGARGMRTVAQLALMTGANPLPGTNGIHAWKDNKGNLNIMFGIGFWRGSAEEEGGLLWIERPRPMTDEEREQHQIADDELAAICSAALKRDAFGLMREAREMGFEMGLKEAKQEVGRVGIGTVGTEKWGGGNYKEEKSGRPLIWTALERAERDLLYQLVPILKRSRDHAHEGTMQTGGEGWRAGEFVRIEAEDPNPPQSIEETNESLFGKTNGGDKREPEDIEYEDIKEAAEVLDGRASAIADMRSAIEEKDSPELRDVVSAALDLGFYDHHNHAYNAVKMFPDLPDGFEVKADKQLKPKGALLLFDWLVDRKLNADEEE